MLKERVKSLALFLLFALSIYLMKELWASDLILTLKNDSQSETKIQDTASVITPRSLVYSYGSGVYSAVFFDVYDTWGSLKSQLVGVMSESMKVEPIPQELYEQKKVGRSVELIFGYTLTLRDLVEILKVDVNKATTDSQTFDRILVLGGQVDSIYLHSGSGYFKLNFKTPKISIDQEITEAENLEETRYRTIENVYKIKSILDTDNGSFKENDQLVPLGSVPNVETIAVVSEYNIGDDGVLRRLISQYFGTHIVKKLVDIDGSLVYLYGYGEKTLKVSENGSIEFKSKLQNIPLKSISFQEALQLSLSFIDRFGGIPKDLRLSTFSYRLEKDVPVYELYFNHRISKLTLEGETDELGIHMTLIGEQVTEYRRYLVLEPENQQSEIQINSNQTLDTLINRNFISILSPNYLNDHPEKINDSTQQSSPNLVFDVLQSINSFETLYYLDEENSEFLIPVWKIGFDHYLYYFDLSDGRILKTERKAE